MLSITVDSILMSNRMTDSGRHPKMLTATGSIRKTKKVNGEMVKNKPKWQQILRRLLELTCAILRPSSPLMSAPESPLMLTLESTTSDVSFDIIANEILPKLPAKSLLRFKSVCKSFYNLISSPEFIHLHLQHSIFSDNRVLVIPATNRTLYTFDLRSLYSSTAASATYCWQLYSNSVVGSCNGLLLITGFFGGFRHVMILNPSTRAYIDVPCTAENLGFGFDQLQDDYKIVAITDVINIFSVNSKSWKTVEFTFPLDASPHPVSGALINNHLLHWIFSVPSLPWTRSKYVIGCFDICLEKWREDIPLPGCYNDFSDICYFLDLGVVDGKLFVSIENRVDLSYEVWVMKEYGVQDSWMKLLSISISDKPKGGVVPVACQDAGMRHVLLQQRHGSNLFWYNRVDDMISKVEVPDFQSRRPYICYDSLVVLPRAKRFKAVYEPPVEE